MDNKISRYKVTLTVKTPTFVGSGKVYSKLDYALYDGYVEIYDIEKLFSIMDENALNRFEEYILNNESPKLYEFLNKKENESLKSEIRQNCLLYKTKPDIVPRGNDICCFMRDAYGNPYIPGSSIKGALRTVFMICYRLANNSVLPMVAEKYFKFNEMRNIRISDTTSSTNDELVICKRDVSVLTRNGYKNIAVYRECLKPETKLCFTLELNKKWLKDNLKVEGLCEAIDKFNACYTELYNDYISTRYHSDEKVTMESGDIILGGGAGELSKRIKYIFDQKVPHRMKFTQYGDNMLHMGICNLEF